MRNRQEHQQEIRDFVQRQLSVQVGTLSLPEGSGAETYIAETNQRNYFLKVGAPIERYVAMAETGLTPPILAHGHLESGNSIIVQLFVRGRTPSQRDYWDQLEKVARIIHRMHNNEKIRGSIPPPASDLHKDAGLYALLQLRQPWKQYRARVTDVAEFVDPSLSWLEEQINSVSTRGLVTSHNDICNANWLFADDGSIYLVDLETMSLDDPALDLGALLWWYYPPELRKRFLDVAGYRYDDELKVRMQIRMSMHCLHIALPRARSFDEFSSDHFRDRLEDFKASIQGKENPKGYGGW